MKAKQIALAKFLDCKAKELSVSKYDDSVFELGSKEFMVLTDKEADERVKESIKETVWAFRASFLESHIKDLDKKSIEQIQQSMNEDANKVLTRLIEDFDHFVNDAVLSDGRGHFLSSYDGEENEQGKFFIYRVN